MNLLKFISLFYKVKTLFAFLPRGIQEELVDDMQDYYNLCRIARIEKERKKYEV